MWNQVSVQWLSLDTTLEWYHKIDDFVAMPRFIPRGRNISTDIGTPALGPQRNQLPQDLDVTFFFDYVKGINFVSPVLIVSFPNYYLFSIQLTFSTKL